MFSGLVIPKINCISELSGTLLFRTNDEVVSTAILSHYECIGWEAAPTTHGCSLSYDIITRPCYSLPVTPVEERNQLPTIASNFKFASVVL